LELDEVWPFVKRRANKRWLWVALCRQTRQVVAYVIGDRSEKSCQSLWRAIPEGYKKARSYSDFWGAYQKEGGGGVHAFVVVQFQVDVTGGAVDGDEQVELVLAEIDLGGAMCRKPGS